MLEWVGISKDTAQKIFEFEALTDQFPGKTLHGSHKPPSAEMVLKYWESTLRWKVENSQSVILLGKIACIHFYELTKNWYARPDSLELPHPSRRNYSRIMNNKEQITKDLKRFIGSGFNG